MEAHCYCISGTGQLLSANSLFTERLILAANFISENDSLEELHVHNLSLPGGNMHAQDECMRINLPMGKLSPKASIFNCMLDSMCWVM